MEYRILCLGEILFDVYPAYKRLGGAPFNFAYHLHRFGQEVAFVSRIGEDDYGREILTSLQQRAFPSRYLQIDPQHSTGRVNVSLDDEGKPEYEIAEQMAYDFLQVEDSVRHFLDNGADLVYFGTLAQRHAVSQAAIQEILRMAPDQATILYDINLRQSFYSKDLLHQSLMQSDVVKLNEDELTIVAQLFGFPAHQEEAAQQLMQQFSVHTLCITKGEAGSSLFLEDRGFHWEPSGTSDLRIIDTVGAGDAFAATLAYGVLEQWSGDQILSNAGRFAAAICTIPGAIPDDADFYHGHAPFAEPPDAIDG